mmetsp:Transcript_1649/g.1803  ORF Transcript_1649/g.1803 Transcript_1649/m.1803 type:complete len:237 (-) Transcript_1649:117-827(-)|eukprot:CAMPEP_0198263628 /NCGR_PEP_ID=MMETSP1447-20131203/12928_1 /TAXON_ID=420782 /ORGANISM="Chaetoceros dichaeta, Strain CCMP1751" /LENGTH=236 /DNA_ID=CAMNT_0043952311 /DNA_START=44 /DNA_END=754 /DNA_ORIENTATION=-
MSSKSAAPPPGMEALNTAPSSAAGSSSGISSSTHGGGEKTPLYEAYPVNSILELTLSPDKEVVQGLVYCTDEISKTIVLKRSSAHTTLASEIQVVNADCVLEKKVLTAAAAAGNSNRNGGTKNEKGENNIDEELAFPLPNVSKKAVEERERRAMKLAEDRLRHVNPKATPEGEAVFEKLLKACNEVVWSGESILVLSQIKVDPPYGSENCKLVQRGGDVALNAESLERVKRIVEAV